MSLLANKFKIHRFSSFLRDSMQTDRHDLILVKGLLWFKCRGLTKFKTELVGEDRDVS